jgi:cyclase
MSEKKIIPCLDIRDGRVVKGIKFEGIKEVGDPVERAKMYNNQGADELVLYDISASIEKRIIPLELVKSVAENISVPLSVAGGIGTIEDFQKVLNVGAEKVSVNSLAVKNPDIIKQAAEKFGSKSVIVGIDTKRDKSGKFVVMTGGGKVETGIDLIDWVKKIEWLGAGEICLNSIDADGMKNGYDIEMLNEICEVISIPIIASGGCGKLEHFLEVFSKTKASAALAASVFHYGEMTVEKVKNYLKNEGILVR